MSKYKIIKKFLVISYDETTTGPYRESRVLRCFGCDLNKIFVRQMSEMGLVSEITFKINMPNYVVSLIIYNSDFDRDPVYRPLA